MFSFPVYQFFDRCADNCTLQSGLPLVDIHLEAHTSALSQIRPVVIPPLAGNGRHVWKMHECEGGSILIHSDTSGQTPRSQDPHASLYDAETFSEQDFLLFTKQIAGKFGLDLLFYKQPQVRRRLNTLRIRKGYQSFAEFFRAIDTNPQLAKAFIDQLTINVTEFYRNPERWKVLRDHVLPLLLRKQPSIKCWSAACSTGEEPYSIVLSLSRQTSLRNVDVLATDLDPSVISQAKVGLYTSTALKNVSRTELDENFTVAAHQFQIHEDIKRCVRFQVHNLFSRPLEVGFDLIVCRNVLIYFTQEAKDQILKSFWAALKPGGYLFVGGTEQISNPKAFGFESPYPFFYRKLEETTTTVRD